MRSISFISCQRHCDAYWYAVYIIVGIVQRNPEESPIGQIFRALPFIFNDSSKSAYDDESSESLSFRLRSAFMCITIRTDCIVKLHDSIPIIFLLFSLPFYNDALIHPVSHEIQIYIWDIRCRIEQAEPLTIFFYVIDGHKNGLHRLSDF